MNIFIHPCFDHAYELSPLVLVDVGARGGLKQDWLPARRHLRLIGFEPDEQEYQRLKDLLTASRSTDLVFNTALHNQRGTITLQVARDGGLSSIYRPNRPFLDRFPEAARFDTVETRTVAADTLDQVLAAHGITDIDFIKADTQGSELLVLQGADAILDSTAVGVEVEVEFTPVYSEQPLFADVDAYLRHKGYQLFDLRPCYWKRARGRDIGGPYGQLIWADALYLKSVPTLCRSIASMTPAGQKSKLLRAISVSLLYGYFDYALELSDSAGDLFDPTERALIDRSLRDQGAQEGPLPKFPGRHRLALASRRLWKLFVQKDDAWSVSSPDLGNLR